VITTLALTPDTPINDHCGKCRRCLDACPTNAIFEDLRAIDSRKCLSYWNIEHRGSIPQEFHAPMQNWLLGCDICQEVCPWTAQSLRTGRKDVGPAPVEWIAADEILALNQTEFKERYSSRALSRAKLGGLQRNAAIVKKNWQAAQDP
jgi:epoxyqueuosine reductase